MMLYLITRKYGKLVLLPVILKVVERQYVKEVVITITNVICFLVRKWSVDIMKALDTVITTWKVWIQMILVPASLDMVPKDRGKVKKVTKENV